MKHVTETAPVPNMAGVSARGSDCSAPSIHESQTSAPLVRDCGVEAILRHKPISYNAAVLLLKPRKLPCTAHP